LNQIQRKKKDEIFIASYQSLTNYQTSSWFKLFI